MFKGYSKTGSEIQSKLDIEILASSISATFGSYFCTLISYYGELKEYDGARVFKGKV